MSSSRGGKGYKPQAKYLTDIAFCRFVVPLLPIPRSAVVLEPHVGEGPWVQALLENGHPARNIIAADLDPGAHGLALAVAAGCRIYTGNFLHSAPPMSVDWVIGNPPYGDPQPETICPLCRGTGVKLRKQVTCSRCDGTGRWVPRPIPVAAAHASRAIELVRPHRGSVFFLLRAAFYEFRTSFWRLHGTDLRAMWAVWPRLAFDPDQPRKTDSCPYATYWWDTTQSWSPSEFRRVQWRESNDADEDDAT